MRIIDDNTWWVEFSSRAFLYWSMRKSIEGRSLVNVSPYPSVAFIGIKNAFHMFLIFSSSFYLCRSILSSSSNEYSSIYISIACRISGHRIDSRVPYHEFHRVELSFLIKEPAEGLWKCWIRWEVFRQWTAILSAFPNGPNFPPSTISSMSSPQHCSFSISPKTVSLDSNRNAWTLRQIICPLHLLL